MLKKKISELLNGKIKIKSFQDIASLDNKIHNIQFGSNENEFSNLYSVKDVRIVKSGNTCLAVLKENFLIKELCFQSKDLVREKIDLNKVYKNGYISFFPKKIKGTSVCLLQDVSQKENYFHFLYDCIVKLSVIENLKEINYDNILIPSKKLNFQKQVIQALNTKKNIIDCDNLEVFDLERLIVIDHPYWKENNLWFNDISNLPEWSVKFLRQKFLNLNYNKKFKNKIFIDRSDSLVLTT